MSTYEKFSCLLNAIGLLLIVVGLLYTGKQIRLMQTSNKSSHEWNK